MGLNFHPSLMAFANVCFDLCAGPKSDMGVVNSIVIGGGDALWFPPPHLVDEYIRRWSSHLDARRLHFFRKVRR